MNEDDSDEPIDQHQPTVVEVKKRERPPLTLSCLVCSAPAPEHLHFGAHCCYSCRAFFRRTVQRKQSNYKLRCRSGKKNCTITNKKGDGRNCISCRYEKCIRIGMVPERLKGKRIVVPDDISINENDEQNQNADDARTIMIDDYQIVQDNEIATSSNRNLEGVELTVDDSYQNFSEESPLESQAHNVQFCQPTETQLGHAQVSSDYSFPQSSNSQFGKTDYYPCSTSSAVTNLSSPTFSTYPMNNSIGFQSNQTSIYQSKSSSSCSFAQTPHNVDRETPCSSAYYGNQHVMNNAFQNDSTPTINYSPIISETQFFQQLQDSVKIVETNETMATSTLVSPRDFVGEIFKSDTCTSYQTSQTFCTIKSESRNRCSYNGFQQASVGSERYEHQRNTLTSFNVNDQRSRTMLEADLLLNKSPVSLVKVEKSKNNEIPVRASVIRGPMNTNLDLGFSTEESKCILKLRATHAANHRSTFQRELFEARVRCHFGTSTMEEIILIVSGGRKIQNYYHYLTMFTIPYFSQLSNRSQHFLMKKNSILCYSLNMAHFYFGHNAQTAIDQERITGLDTGLVDYIQNHVPSAANMGAAVYENHFVAPWATSKDHEVIHKEASKIIGDTTKELDVCAYLLLYGIALYNIQDNLLSILNIPEQEVTLIKKAQNYLNLLYNRYCQHLVGASRSSEPRMNQHYILAQLQKCEMVYSMENLHLDDLSDSKGLDVQAVGSL